MRKFLILLGVAFLALATIAASCNLNAPIIGGPAPTTATVQAAEPCHPIVDDVTLTIGQGKTVEYELDNGFTAIITCKGDEVTVTYREPAPTEAPEATAQPTPTLAPTEAPTATESITVTVTVNLPLWPTTAAEAAKLFGSTANRWEPTADCCGWHLVERAFRTVINAQGYLADGYYDTVPGRNPQCYAFNGVAELQGATVWNTAGDTAALQLLLSKLAVPMWTDAQGKNPTPHPCQILAGN